MTSNEVLTELRKIDAPDRMLFLCYRGSISHNTYVISDDPRDTPDTDILGVFLSPLEYYLGISQHKLDNPTTIEIKQEVDGVLFDCVFYEIRHFVGMALKSNPNVFSALWVRPEHYIFLHNRFIPYIDNRNIFLSRRQLYKSFTGYANGQLKEMTQYNKQGYMGEKRKKIIEKFGYDVKNASHLIRLLHMGIEALQTGHIKVFRDADAEMLIGIKLGKWELDEVKMYADSLFNKAKKAYEESTLQEEPDTVEVEHILMGILYKYLITEMPV